MKVYAYHVPVPGLEDPDLINLWRASWARHGWDPVVLTEADAYKADSAMTERLKRSPLLQSHPLNPPGYVLACLLRYVPMTVLTEPALAVDWDVLCNGARPEDMPKHGFPLTFFPGCLCPCAIYGNPAAWRMIAAVIEGSTDCDWFRPDILRKDNAEQYVTMYEMPKDYWLVSNPKLCTTYHEEPDWKRGKMIHFPNRLTGYPRSRAIRMEGFTA